MDAGVDASMDAGADGSSNEDASMPPVETWGDHLGISLFPSVENFDKARALGVRWVRISWEMNWGPFDPTLISHAHAIGLNVLEACQKATHVYTAADVESFASYCASWVDAGVDAIEIGNEWNHLPFYAWNGGNPDSSYASQASFFDAAAASIRQKSPTVPVMNSGWSPEASPNDPTSAMAKSLDAATSFKSDGNAIGHHPYAYDCGSPLTCGIPNHPEWNAFFQTRTVYAAAKMRGYDHPVWLTELGGPSGNGQSAFGVPYTLDTQQKLLLDYFAGIASMRVDGIPIGVVFVHTIQDGQSATSALEKTFGVYDEAWQLKPSGQVVRDQALLPW